MNITDIGAPQRRTEGHRILTCKRQLEAAIANVATLANPAWNHGWSGDQYHKRLQETWVKHNRVQEACNRQNAFDLLSDIADQSGTPSVRSSIPFSRLAHYGDYLYQGRSDHSSTDINIVAGGSCFTDPIEAAFHQLKAGPCIKGAVCNNDNNKEEYLDIFALERSVKNGLRYQMQSTSNEYSPFKQHSPFENWQKELTAPLSMSSGGSTSSETPSAWANVVLDMYPRFLEVLRVCSSLNLSKFPNVPLSINYKEILREPVSPLEAYALSSPDPLEAHNDWTDASFELILWNRISSQSVKELWLSEEDIGLLGSLFPTLTQQGGTQLSTAFLADRKLMLRWQLEIYRRLSEQGRATPSSSDCRLSYPSSILKHQGLPGDTSDKFPYQTETNKKQSEWANTLSTDIHTVSKQTSMEAVVPFGSFKGLLCGTSRSEESFPRLSKHNATWLPTVARMPWNVVVQLQPRSPRAQTLRQPIIQHNTGTLHKMGRSQVQERKEKSAKPVLSRAEQKNQEDKEKKQETYNQYDQQQAIKVVVGSQKRNKKPQQKRECTLAVPIRTQHIQGRKKKKQAIQEDNRPKDRSGGQQALFLSNSNVSNLPQLASTNNYRLNNVNNSQDVFTLQEIADDVTEFAAKGKKGNNIDIDSSSSSEKLQDGTQSALQSKRENFLIDMQKSSACKVSPLAAFYANLQISLKKMFGYDGWGSSRMGPSLLSESSTQIDEDDSSGEDELSGPPEVSRCRDSEDSLELEESPSFSPIASNSFQASTPYHLGKCPPLEMPMILCFEVEDEI